MDKGSGGSRLTVDEIAGAYARELTSWRERRLLSKRGLAEAMGYDRSYVSHVEACNQAPSDEFTRKAERVLGCDGALWSRWEAYAIAHRRQRRAPATRPVVPLQALWTTAQLAGMLSIGSAHVAGVAVLWVRPGVGQPGSVRALRPGRGPALAGRGVLLAGSHLHVLGAHLDGWRRWVKAGERSVP